MAGAFAGREVNHFRSVPWPSYGAMVEQLDWLDGAFRAGAIGFPDIVRAGEDLLSAENRTWADRMAQMPFIPPGLADPTLPGAGT